MRLCDTFRRQAFWTWEQIEKANSVDSHLGEEALTEFNLLEFKMRHQHEIITKSFNKREEGVEGADWEWWLTGSTGGWLGFRIQAKVINTRTQRFEHLHYARSSGTFQSDLLWNRSVVASPARIPLYCLYNYWPNRNQQLNWHCGSYGAAHESYGCSLLDAGFVRQTRTIPNSDQLQFLLPKMLPWHCLVCCEGYGNGDLPNRALNVWRALVRQDRQRQATGNVIDKDDVNFEVVKQPPRYVSSLLKTEMIDPPDKFFKTITIFRERDLKE
jgi:hypothetical protein